MCLWQWFLHLSLVWSVIYDRRQILPAFLSLPHQMLSDVWRWKVQLSRFLLLPSWNILIAIFLFPLLPTWHWNSRPEAPTALLGISFQGQFSNYSFKLLFEICIFHSNTSDKFMTLCDGTQTTEYDFLISYLVLVLVQNMFLSIIRIDNWNNWKDLLEFVWMIKVVDEI